MRVSCDQLVGHKLWNELSSLSLGGWERKPQSLLQLLTQTTSHTAVSCLCLDIADSGQSCTGLLYWARLTALAVSTPVLAQRGVMVAAAT